MEPARCSIDASPALPPPSPSEDEGAQLLRNAAESVSGPEEPGEPKKPWRLARRRETVKLLLTALVLLIGVLAVVGWIMYWRATSALHLAGEINGLVPQFPVRPVLFELDPLSTSDHKTAESENATEEYWLSFMPPVQPDPAHILPPPMLSQDSEYYSIAVFHQLHCLHSIMKGYNDVADQLELARRGRLQWRGRDGLGTNGMRHHPDHRRHMDHCFRYLRQSLLCCSDTALEGQNPRAPLPDTDGTGAVHLCKDYARVKAWAEERRMSDAHSV
ncbi:4e08c213-3b42-4990-b3c8-ca00dfe960cc [Thermothielavioides terrestris]|uniref:4e08c213-3b42-4990-b3c8-ca00dfe960cc n=1 Tax=Thermothielavioides terrestris TaxID=2587410 RepID=A0A446BDY2_9PEZI|nr:4e08c213-3b42-4990-b3c8-ca00dfe960cc [Thermothielavioides terrestris]